MFLPRLAVALSLLLYLGGCAVSVHWFETKSWFSEKEIESGAPNYIPLAAVLDKSELEKSLPANIKKKQALPEKEKTDTDKKAGKLKQ